MTGLGRFTCVGALLALLTSGCKESSDDPPAVPGVNATPVHTVPGPSATDEDVALVFTGATAISISDPDTGAADVQVTLTAVNGTLTLSGIAGLAFAVGDGTADAAMTFTGPISAINRALDGLSFAPVPNYSGPASLEIATNDLGNSGEGGPRTAADSVSIMVRDVSFNAVLKSFNGHVHAIVPVPGGSGDVYVGGQFTTYRDAGANRIVRLKPDGAIDPTFAFGTGFDGSVHAIAPAPDGSGDIYVGGLFNFYQGVGSVNSIVRLNADGSRDTSFDMVAAFGARVRTIVPAPDGSGDVYVGGEFLFYKGAPASRIVRVKPDGSREAAFDMGTGFDDIVYAIAPAGDATTDIYVGGAFANYDGSAAPRIIRLTSTGSAEPAFAPGTGFGTTVHALLSAGDGSGDVYVGGAFIAYQGAGANRMVRLNGDGTPDGGFALGAGFSDSVRSLAWAADASGDIYAGGDFASCQGVASGRIARLNPDGSRDAGFVVGGFNGPVWALAPASDGSGDVLAGGAFVSYGAEGADRIARLNPDGSTDVGFEVGSGFDADVVVVAPAGDASGDVYVGGYFTRYRGSGASGILRLNPDGSRDTAFDVGIGFLGPGPVVAITPAADASGAIYVGGAFTSYRGLAANRIIRLKADGSVDATFAAGTGFNGQVHAVAAADDGSGDLFVGGVFTTYQGSAASRIIRLKADGSVESAFAIGAGFNGAVLAILPVGDGSGGVWVGGDFTTYQGASASRIARLNPDGSIDAGFGTGTGFNGRVRSMASAGDGSGDMYVGGEFTTYDGAVANRIARLNADGSGDAGFAMDWGFAGGVVYSIASVPDGSGSLYVGGAFTAYQGVAANRLVRLRSDGLRDASFNVGASTSNAAGGGSAIYTIAVARDGSGDLYVGGAFTSYREATVNYVFKVMADGLLD